MSELKDLYNKYFRLAVFVVFLVVIAFLIVRNIGAFGNVLLVMLGFGAVVLVHEFGHFIIAKLSNIRVEAFSIFMPPILMGIKRTENGLRFRILPEIFPKQGDESGEGLLSLTLGKSGRAGETEYRIGLIPFGGFVKMLGQDDIGPVKTSDDPRSYANKPVYIRAVTIAAGVVFNVISAVIIFMITFLIGIELQPAVVGDVTPGSPAARAGLKAGDEIIEISGKKEDLDFSNITIAAALSGKDEAVPMKVRHTDGSEESYSLVAELLPREQVRLFGIEPAASLTVANLSGKYAEDFYSRTDLRPGDRITSVDGRDIRGHWELIEILQNSLVPEVTLSVERKTDDGQVEVVKLPARLNMSVASNYDFQSEPDLSHVYSMVPRMKIDAVSDVQGQAEGGDRLKISTVETAPVRAEGDSGSYLLAGDIILAVNDVNNPTYKELRDTVAEYKDKELPVRVLRVDANGVEKSRTIIVTPRRQKGSDRVVIGIVPVLDAEHPVVAKTITYDGGPSKLDIPSGAAIRAVDGQAVSSFYDVVREIRRYPNQRITIEWRLDEETAGSVALDVGADDKFITARSMPDDDIPFTILEKSYKADGPINAIVMGYQRTVMFIAQTYVTLKRLVGGLVSPKNLMGPVGIIKASYDIVSEKPLVTYIYFLGLISAVIAVFNFLPLPPLDGGLVLLLLVEKLKGSALSERVQTIIAYTGWVLILALFLYVTFNDIVRSFFGPSLGS